MVLAIGLAACEEAGMPVAAANMADWRTASGLPLSAAEFRDLLGQCGGLAEDDLADQSEEAAEPALAIDSDEAACLRSKGLVRIR
ncbi:MAG: hypothetical protein JO267_05475 [Alphaproteobacteria bacterium]|nr:hypothetical protein [Alphaproteobacteria bacterium]